MAKDIRELLARGVIDPEFKKELLEDFAAVAKREGVDLTKDELENFQNMTLENWDILEERMVDFVKSSPCPYWLRRS